MKYAIRAFKNYNSYKLQKQNSMDVNNLPAQTKNKQNKNIK